MLTAGNEYLRMAIRPEAGAKIESLVYLPASLEILWSNPRLAVVPAAPGACYDDHWAGGWDELFPNDEPASVAGMNYPDHGEMWTCRWECRMERHNGAEVVLLETRTPVTCCRVEKRITLPPGEPHILFHHRITNQGPLPVPYLWKLHPAFRVEPGDRLILPAGRFLREPAFPGTLGGRDVDLLAVAAPCSRELYFVYGVDLQEGRCGIFRPASGLEFSLSFSTETFSTCWLFASYGGWNDYHVAVLEPCTGYPFRLEEAAAAGRARVLPPGASIEAEVVFSVVRR